jgi:uncharacterized membrane protein YjgN (DUF898 family)
MGGICELRSRDGLRYHDMNTKFYNVRLRYSSDIKVIASTICEAAVLVLLMGGFCVSCLDGLRYHDMNTKIYNVRLRYSSDIKVIASTICEAAVLVLLKEEDP